MRGLLFLQNQVGREIKIMIGSKPLYLEYLDMLSSYIFVLSLLQLIHLL